MSVADWVFTLAVAAVGAFIMWRFYCDVREWRLKRR